MIVLNAELCANGNIIIMEYIRKENKRLKKKILELESYIKGLKDAIHLAAPRK